MIYIFVFIRNEQSFIMKQTNHSPPVLCPNKFGLVKTCIIITKVHLIFPLCCIILSVISPIQASYFMMQQGGVVTITKPNAYLVRLRERQNSILEVLLFMHVSHFCSLGFYLLSTHFCLNLNQLITESLKIIHTFQKKHK